VDPANPGKKLVSMIVPFANIATTTTRHNITFDVAFGVVNAVDSAMNER
jgi:hypothetical protein